MTELNPNTSIITLNVNHFTPIRVAAIKKKKKNTENNNSAVIINNNPNSADEDEGKLM